MDQDDSTTEKLLDLDGALQVEPAQCFVDDRHQVGGQLVVVDSRLARMVGRVADEPDDDARRGSDVLWPSAPARRDRPPTARGVIGDGRGDRTAEG